MKQARRVFDTLDDINDKSIVQLTYQGTRKNYKQIQSKAKSHADTSGNVDENFCNNLFAKQQQRRKCQNSEAFATLLTDKVLSPRSKSGTAAQKHKYSTRHQSLLSKVSPFNTIEPAEQAPKRRRVTYRTVKVVDAEPH